MCEGKCTCHDNIEKLKEEYEERIKDAYSEGYQDGLDENEGSGWSDGYAEAEKEYEESVPDLYAALDDYEDSYHNSAYFRGLIFDKFEQIFGVKIQK